MMAAGNALHCICMALLPELSVTPKLIPQFPSSFCTALRVGGSLLSPVLGLPNSLAYGIVAGFGLVQL